MDEGQKFGGDYSPFLFTPQDGGRKAAEEADAAPRFLRPSQEELRQADESAVRDDDLDQEEEIPETVQDKLKKTLIRQFGSWEAVPEPVKGMLGFSSSETVVRKPSQSELELMRLRKAGEFAQGRNFKGQWASEVLLELQEKYGENKIHGEECGCGDPKSYTTHALIDLYELDTNFRSLLNTVTTMRGTVDGEMAKEIVNTLKIAARHVDKSLREVGASEKQIRYYVRDLFSPILNEGIEKDW